MIQYVISTNQFKCAIVLNLVHIYDAEFIKLKIAWFSTTDIRPSKRLCVRVVTWAIWAKALQ
jgi:hypothetical protein